MESATAIPARFLSILDFDHEALSACLQRAAEYKAARVAGVTDEPVLARRHVALLFEKPSLRTRSTFQIAVRELGGDIIEPGNDVALGGRESIADVARNLERWVFAAVVRTYAQDRLREFADAAPRLRVLNALTNEEHPCQALADCLTLQEAWSSLRGRTIAFVGDGNNVATSLAHAAVMLGAHVRIASPVAMNCPITCSTMSRASHEAAPPWISSPIPSRRSRGPMPSIPTSGRRWGKNARPRPAIESLRHIR
jgi:ornithine carbamoyltransferase